MFTVSQGEHDGLRGCKTKRHAEAERFSHPSRDPLWAAAMAILLFFTGLSFIGTTVNVYFLYADSAFLKATVPNKGLDNPSFETMEPAITGDIQSGEQLTEFGLIKQEPSKMYPSLARFGKIFSIRNNMANLFDTYRPKAVIKVRNIWMSNLCYHQEL